MSKPSTAELHWSSPRRSRSSRTGTSVVSRYCRKTGSRSVPACSLMWARDLVAGDDAVPKRVLEAPQDAAPAVVDDDDLPEVCSMLPPL
jgi:hypothetical protein